MGGGAGGADGGEEEPTAGVSRQNSNGSTSSAMIQSLASEGDNPESSRLENELLKEELQQVE